MFNSSLQIKFIPLPCIDVKYFVEDDIKKPISIASINKDQLSSYFDRRTLSVTYKQSQENFTVNQKEFINKTNNLLSAFKYDILAPFRGNFKEKPKYEVFTEYLKKYGPPFWLGNHQKNTKYHCNVYSIVDEINNLVLIKDIIAGSIDIDNFIPGLMNKVSETIKLFGTDRLFKICQKDGRLAIAAYRYNDIDVKTNSFRYDGLGIFIQDIEGFKQKLDDFREDFDDPVSTQEWVTWLRQLALSSAAEYLSSWPVKFISEIDGGKPLLKLTTNNPFAYYLLLMSNWTNKKFDKNNYNKEYCQRPYPKVTAYFRGWLKAGKIGPQKYERAKALAKILCKDEGNSYYSARIQIENELEDGEPHA